MLSEQNYIKGNIIPVCIILAVVLIGYHKVFLGYNFWTYIDTLANSSWAYGNSLGNGWRPDKGFGISFFYSDTGSWHPWSLRVFWMKLISSRALAYSTFVIFHSILVAIAMFFFLKKIVPTLNPIVSSLLCPLIVFAPGMDNIYFESRTSVSLAVIPLMLMVFYEYYKNPKLLHFFLVSLIFWYNLFFGYFLTWSVLPSIGLTFTIIYSIYYKRPFLKLLLRYILLFSIGSLVALLLGSWEMYSIFYEGNITEFARSKDWFAQTKLNFDSLTFLPKSYSLFLYFINFFYFYTIPTDITVLGAGWRPFYYGWSMAPFFPIVIIYFLFRSSSSFWEFSCKWILLAYYLLKLLFLSPMLSQAHKVVTNIFIDQIGFIGLPLFNWYFTSWNIFIVPMQLALIAIFLNDLVYKKYIFKNLFYDITKNIIAILFFIISLLYLAFSFFSLFTPDLLPEFFSNLVEQIGPQYYKEYPNYFLSYMTWFNLKVLQDTIHWYSLLFYLITTLVFLFFLRIEKFIFYVKANQLICVVILLCGGIFYSWHVYPLNNHPLVWKEIYKDLPKFKPYDRFLYVGNSETIEGLKAQKFHRPKKFIEFKKRVEMVGGPEIFASSYRRIFKGGLHESPGLRLHGHLGFYQKNVSDFIVSIFSPKNINRSILREQYIVGHGPVISSELLDLSAVTYYYSEKELINPPENLSLVYKKKANPESPISLNIYKNISAWPYFYLANTTKIIEEQDIKDIQLGSAYVGKDNFFELSGNAEDSWIKLNEFKYGKLIFDYYGNRSNFLVVADAWHPNWKAKLNETNLEIIKVNKIFKGIKIPPGKGKVILFFDTSSYKPGIYITLVSWSLFLTFFLFLTRKKSIFK